MKKKENAQKRVDIGGQAVLEGVMMRSPEWIALAVRRPDGSIVVKRDRYESPAKKHKWMGWPFIRGSVSMVQMLSMGMKTLETSMKMGGIEEEPTRFEKWLSKKVGKGIDKIVMGTAIVLALCLSVGLFILLPNAIIRFFPPNAEGGMLILKNLATGLVRTVLLLGYLWLCGRVPDMKRTFAYHGSEHKTVYCHEHNLPLTPENAQQFSTLHPRCGTSFLLITFVLSILFYSVVDVAVLAASGYNLGDHYLVRIFSRILLLPMVAGISYETLKGLAHSNNKLTCALRWPGLMLQKLTTSQPDKGMLEVAICSMNAALGKMPEGEKTPEGYFRVIPTASAET